MIRNKKGNIKATLFIIMGLFLLVMIGILMAFGSSIINLTMDTIEPEMIALGVVGDFNASEATDYTVTPVNNFIQSMTWVSGVIYILGLIGIFGVAFAFRTMGDKWLIGLFFALALILIIGCIFLSNIYEDFYDDTGDLGPRLKEHTLLSYMILYSPAIMSIVVFLAGIILFSGPEQEGF